jgi:putative RecB family exonuclease
MSSQRQAPQTPNQPGLRFADFSPVHVTTHQQCPEKFYLKHIKRQWTPKTLSRPLVVGQATHAALAWIWNQRLDGFEFPDDLVGVARLYLKESQYRDEPESWREDVHIVAGHIERCLAALDPDPEIISVEREWSWRLRSRSGEPAVTIKSRVDLIVKRREGAVEHIDYKTGRRERDLVQEVMSRVVVGAMLRERGMDGAPIVTSTLFSKEGALVSETMDREQCAPVWDGIVTTIQEIRDATTWRPRPGPHCRWCDFAARHCSVGGEKRDQ